MNRKYHEFAGKFLTVLAVSGIIALLIRLKLMAGKPDAFFFNMMFVLMIILITTLYSHFILLGEEIIEFITRFFRKKNIGESQIGEDKNQILDKNILALKDSKPNLTDSDQNLESDNQISEILYDNDLSVDVSDIEKIRIRTKSKNEEIIKEKLDFLVSYTQEKFALYTSDEDINRFCIYLIDFLKDSKIENINQVKIETLSTTDLMHFGWNVWSYHKGRNQRKDVAKFLKTVFSENFKEMEETTIEKLLSSRKNEGLIKINENLLQ